MGGTQLDHLAGTDEQHPLGADPLENPLGQMNGCRRHGDGIGTDGRGGAHFLGHREGALEQLVHGRPEGARRFGLTHRILHLPEDLRLADDHRV